MSAALNAIIEQGSTKVGEYYIIRIDGMIHVYVKKGTCFELIKAYDLGKQDNETIAFKDFVIRFTAAFEKHKSK